jgi:hypothetical protein
MFDSRRRIAPWARARLRDQGAARRDDPRALPRDRGGRRWEWSSRRRRRRGLVVSCGPSPGSPSSSPSPAPYAYPVRQKPTRRGGPRRAGVSGSCPLSRLPPAPLTPEPVWDSSTLRLRCPSCKLGPRSWCKMRPGSPRVRPRAGDSHPWPSVSGHAPVPDFRAVQLIMRKSRAFVAFCALTRHPGAG